MTRWRRRACTAAGWKVRVLPDDTGSSEGNPPTFGDFVTRDLRWAGGNMQYRALLRLPGQTPMARWQLVQAMLLFLGAPLWCAILLLAAVNALTGGGAATPTGLLRAAAALRLGCATTRRSSPDMPNCCVKPGLAEALWRAG